MVVLLFIVSAIHQALIYIGALLFFFFVGKSSFGRERGEVLSFYAMFSYFLISFVGYLVLIVIARFAFLVGVDQYHPLVDIGAAGLTWLFFYALFKKKENPVRKYFSALKDESNKILLVTVDILLFLFIVILGSHYILIELFPNLYDEYTFDVIIVLIILATCLVIGSIIAIRVKNKREMDALKDLQIQNLQVYALQIEEMYDEIRAFRHDSVNLMLSMEEGLKAKDLDSVQKAFYNVVKPSGDILRNADFTMSKLKNMQIPEIKSLLISKVVMAQSKKIDVLLEIEDPITETYFGIIDYFRVLSILLDNAIEAAVRSEKPKLMIAFIQEDGEQIIVISNSTQEEAINVSKLSLKGHSSKGEDHGFGLHTVDQIITEHQNLALETQSKGHIFTQKLITKEVKRK